MDHANNEHLKHTTLESSKNKGEKSKTSSACIVFMIALVLFLVIAILGLLIALLLVKPSNKKEDSKADFRSAQWTDRRCFTKKCSKRWDPMPVVVVSMDGFWANYMDRGLTPTLQRIADCGVHAPFMYSCYPSKTFPNHYSIATGLYPESHGIVGNRMWDPTIKPPEDRYFSLGHPSSNNSGWWLGEPMWNTVQKNGQKSASFFWPGSEMVIDGMRPTYYKIYDKSVPFSVRVNQIVKWLLLPDSERPTFINIYLNQPDAYGHKYGPFSDQVNDALILVDGTVNHLMTELYRNDLLACVNVILLADHGMQQLVPNDQITVSEYVNIEGMRVFPSAAGRIMLANSSLTTKQVIDSMRCKNGPFRVYPRKDLPVRLHYSRTERIGDIIVDGDLGYYVYGEPTIETEQGAHGYDYRETSMHALFMAHGPAFRKSLTVEPFENIEVYNLVADILKLKKRAPTNGTRGSLHKMLRDPPPMPLTPAPPPIGKCFNLPQWSACRGCTQTDPISIKTCDRKIGVTPFDTTDLCTMDTCTYGLVYSKATGAPLVVETGLSTRSILDQSQLTSRCSFATEALSSCSAVFGTQARLQFDSLGYYPLALLAENLNDQSVKVIYQKLPLYDGFVQGMFGQLQQLITTYAQSYKKLLMWTGPIYDYDRDGLADSQELIRLNTRAGLPPVPTHVFNILLRCDNGWKADGKSCQDPENARVIAFALPNKPSDINCMSPSAYIFMNTARVRDIEELTGLQFFTNTSQWPPDQAVRLRIHINAQLW